jgi:hypothetical protein
VPVITVTAAALPSPLEETEALSELAAAVALALALPPEAVYVTLIHAGPSVLGGAAVAPRPVVLLHGRERPGAGAALDAAKASAGRAWGCPSEGVWAQWLVTS